MYEGGFMEVYKMSNCGSEKSAFSVVTSALGVPVVPIVPRLMRVVPLSLTKVIGDFDANDTAGNVG